MSVKARLTSLRSRRSHVCVVRRRRRVRSDVDEDSGSVSFDECDRSELLRRYYSSEDFSREAVKRRLNGLSDHVVQSTFDVEYVSSVGVLPVSRRCGSGGDLSGSDVGGVGDIVPRPFSPIDSGGERVLGGSESSVFSYFSPTLDQYPEVYSSEGVRKVLYDLGAIGYRESLGLSLPSLEDCASSYTLLKRESLLTKSPGMVHDVSPDSLCYEQLYWLLLGMGDAKDTCGTVSQVDVCKNPSCKSRGNKSVGKSSVGKSGGKNSVGKSYPVNLRYCNCGRLDCSNPHCRAAGIKRKLYDKIKPRCDDLLSELDSAGYRGLELRHCVLSIPVRYYSALHCKSGFDRVRKEVYHLLKTVIGSIGGVVLFHPYRHTEGFKLEHARYRSDGGTLSRWEYWYQQGYNRDMFGVQFSPHFHILGAGFFTPDLVFFSDLDVRRGPSDLGSFSGLDVPSWVRDHFSSHGVSLGSGARLSFVAGSRPSWRLSDDDGSEYVLKLNKSGTRLYVLQSFYSRTGGWIFKNIDGDSDDIDAVPGDSFESRIKYLLTHVGRPFEEGVDKPLSGNSYYCYGAFSGKVRRDEYELTDADFSQEELDEMDCRYDVNIQKWVRTCPGCGCDLFCCDCRSKKITRSEVESGEVDWDSELLDCTPDVSSFRMKRSRYYFVEIPKIVEVNYMLYSDILDYIETVNRGFG